MILSLHPRGAAAWFESTMETIYFTENQWQFKVLQATTPFGRKFGEMCRRLIWQRGHKGTMANRAEAIAYYEQHIQNIKAEVPPDKLLVFTADQGWEPLCHFIGVPAPATPYPNVNSRTEFQKIKRNVAMGAYAIMGVAIAAAGALTYGLLQVLP